MNYESAPTAESLAELLHELEKAKNAVTRALFSPPFGTPPPEGDASENVEELATLMRQARMAMLQNPAGTRTVVRLLIEEGRRFAETDEGAAWQQRLLASDELEPLRDMWEAISLSVFDDLEDEQEVPKAWLDLVTDVATNSTSMEALIEAMRPEGLA